MIVTHCPLPRFLHMPRCSRAPRFLLLACAAAGLLLRSQGPAPAAPPPGYRLAWSDEFHQGVGARPDPAVWGYDTGAGGWGNKELETYVSDIEHAQIVAAPGATDGQALQILSTNTHGYESVRMLTAGKKTFQYGFFEARIKLPYGQGIWPAFWMLGANIHQVGWPACGEVDIMENIGKASWAGHNLSSLHGGVDSALPAKAHANFTKNAPYDLPAGATFHDGFHLFQMLWVKDSFSFYVDGTLYETRTPAEYGRNPWPFNAPFFLLLDTAVGGDWPGKPDATTLFPQRMLVDYIRVYQGTPTRPPAPKGLTARPTDGRQVRLSWAGDINATSYRLYRSTKRGGAGGTPLKADLAAVSFLDTGLAPATKYYYAVAAVNAAGESPRSPEQAATAPRAIAAAFGARPWPLPGTVEAEDYDKGGEGIGFHDKDGVNSGGGAYRPGDGVDLEDCTDTGGGYYVGWTASGQWLNYTVAALPGAYTAEFRVSAAGAGGRFHLEDARGKDLTGPITVPGTGGWQDWTTVRATVSLPAGRQVLKLVEDSGGYDLNRMTFARK